MAENTGGTPAPAGTPPAADPPVNPPPAADPPVNPPPAADPPSEPPGNPPPAADPPSEPPQAFDWAAARESVAKGDEKLSKRLARYSTLESALEALVAAQDKIAKGETLSRPGADASPEERAAWREANGIPESADKYDLKLDDGLVIGEADKPLVDEFLKVAHELDATPDEASKYVNWYLATQEKAAADRAVQDDQIAQTTRQELRDAWGTEFEVNTNIIKNMLGAAPDGVGEAIMNARGPDGVPICSNKAVLRWLADTARVINPIATVVPGSGTNAMQTIDVEIGKLYALSADTNSEYWKGPNAEKLQARYRDLLDAKSKIEAQGT